MTSPLIIETNIEGILSDHLHTEVALIEAEMSMLKERLQAFSDRREKLLRIAEAAGIVRPQEEP